ncbi:MAG: hypothetical protein IT495_05945 [Gammaproteobacteria bacterium]|nr:hypothetical protein [Gammaproteobacteria bacterium]
MLWYHFVAYFFAGALLANGVPHYVMGTTGRRFPTPFAVPPGKGESSALVNVIWGLVNAAAGGLLLLPGSFVAGLNPPTLAFALGVAAMSGMLARHFGQLYTPLH